MMHEDISEDDLEARILSCHENDDREALAELYSTAGLRLEQKGEVDPACFFMTQAYVFALETGKVSLASDLWARLKKHRREA